MKNFFILFAAVALMAMTACNEKPAKENANQPAVEKAGKKLEKIDPSKTKAVNLEKVGPTEDGKDHEIAHFKTKEYDVNVVNLADGTMRVTLKGGDGDQVYESKNCRYQGKNYLMQTTDGKNILLTADEGRIAIMDKKQIIYTGKAEQ